MLNLIKFYHLVKFDKEKANCNIRTSMFDGFIVIWKNRLLIARMAMKDISDRYAGNSLGKTWSIISPLFLVGIYAFIFTFIFQIKIGSGKPVEYALYALAGLIPWIVMQEGLVKSTSSILSNPTLVKQVIFPIDILPVNSVLSSLPTIIFGFLIFVIISIIFMPQNLGWLLLLLPLIILVHFIFSIGIGWFLSAVGVYFRDLREIVSLMLLIFMFITPVLYLENMLPKALVVPIKLNPFTHILNMYRDILINNQILHPWSFVIFGVLALLCFVIGFKFFKKVKPYFSNVL